MASSAPKVAPPERRDAPEVIDQQADELAALIKKSKHLIVFTGAGVSTSAGIPDFRGPEGAWTLRAQGRARTGKATNTLQAIPTPTHMALVELQRQDFRAVATYDKSVHDHRTGRKCTQCGGNLHDTIINFSESLPEEPLKLANKHAKKADLCLVLGSSLSVHPASSIPETCGKNRKSKLIICNLQNTFMENLADMHVWSESDALMTRVMERLELPIPVFILKRRLVIRTEKDAHDRQTIVLTGVDDDGTPVTYLESVKLEYNRRVARAEPFSFTFRETLADETELGFVLEFMGHYNEPNLVVTYNISEQEDMEAMYDLQYDPSTGEWVTTRS
ncbi:hypothetical protein ACHAPU_002874 [Fusarium lateritium]